MDLVLSAPKTILLAVQLAAKADIDSLAFLAEQQSNILHKELLLRILLTYLPKSLETLKYVSFIEKIESGDFTDVQPVQLDLSAVNNLTEEEASRRVRKLRLQQLTWPNSPEQLADDPTSLFLLRRAYAVDEEAGLLDQLPDLLVPFLQCSSYIRRWLVSSLLPLLRRNVEYHPESPLSHTIATFEQLPDRDAVTQLLSQTGVHEPDYQFIGRDLKGMIGPWLLDESRWPNRDPTTPQSPVGKGDFCPGWEQVLQWLTYQAAKSWKVAVSAIEQWDGPSELDLGGYGTMWLEDAEQEYLERRYAQAAIACAYLIPDTSDEALSGAHNIAVKIMSLLDQDPAPPLHTSASLLSPIPELEGTDLISVQNAKHLRNDLLKDDNTLTSPNPQSLQLLHGLVLSAFLITRLGVPCTVRRAGELVLLQDEREQRSAAIQLIKHIIHNTQKTDDKHWIQMRNEILWLRDWGAEERAETSQCLGVFGQVKKEYLEVEFLKALLANTRYTLAKTLYEDSTDAPLPSKVIQDTVYAAALNAYDNASNPNRTRGGVKKCNDILHSFPRTVDRSLVATQRIEALLKATHTLSNYRLVLKKGEPFTPVVLRVHSDPISIIGKVLEQNPGSYTKIQEFLDLGANMVEAGLTVKDQSGHSTLTAEQEPEQRVISERRVTAMCVDAALEEDDFETAYSYIVNRIAELPSSTQSSGSTLASHIQDGWSWKAALQAGKYRRTERTVRPTHLGTTSGNPEVRHLEQRIECLATALRIAPAATLQEILNSYRRCEEELDAAAKAESEQENAWDDAADRQAMPGTFGTSPGPAGVLTGRAAAASGSSGGRQHLHNAEEAPLSLFDLSRATARLASRNFAALSSLQQSGQTRSGEQPGASHHAGLASGDDDSEHHQRVRKRDQLRDAAMGTLVSGVGWLVGAQPADRGQERE